MNGSKALADFNITATARSKVDSLITGLAFSESVLLRAVGYLDPELVFGAAP